jgi:PDZ domain-containing secreted protein
VGLVGYVDEKAVAARESGATLLLVPDGEFTDGAGRHLAVRSVTSLREALAALTTR